MCLFKWFNIQGGLSSRLEPIADCHKQAFQNVYVLLYIFWKKLLALVLYNDAQRIKMTLKLGGTRLTRFKALMGVSKGGYGVAQIGSVPNNTAIKVALEVRTVEIHTHKLIHERVINRRHSCDGWDRKMRKGRNE